MILIVYNVYKPPLKPTQQELNYSLQLEQRTANSEPPESPHNPLRSVSPAHDGLLSGDDFSFVDLLFDLRYAASAALGTLTEA